MRTPVYYKVVCHRFLGSFPIKNFELFHYKRAKVFLTSLVLGNYNIICIRYCILSKNLKFYTYFWWLIWPSQHNTFTWYSSHYYKITYVSFKTLLAFIFNNTLLKVYYIKKCFYLLISNIIIAITQTISIEISIISIQIDIK